MVTIEKMARLAAGSCFDSEGPMHQGIAGEIGACSIGSGANNHRGAAYRYSDHLTFDANKLSALGRGTKHDVCASTASDRAVNGLEVIGNVARSGICHSFTRDGRCVSLFKTLFTNSCSHQCGYCPNAAGCAALGSTFSYTPKELAGLTMRLYRGNYIEGLFLSSGAGRDEEKAMEGMIETVSLLRSAHRFMGYVHMKILPGTSRELIRQAMELSDRVSINIEAHSAASLEEISPTKDFENDILQRQRYISDLMRTVPMPSGQTTQFVVGGAEESDKEIYERVISEYEDLRVKRAYFSAFSPIPGTRLSKKKAVPLWRENRLYQIDWLWRVYKMRKDEIDIAFNDCGNLSNEDPKLLIARTTMDRPLDPNIASYQELIRVPGIGPTSARRIILLRKNDVIRRRRQLSSIGVSMKRASPFLKVDGVVETTIQRWSD